MTVCLNKRLIVLYANCAGNILNQMFAKHTYTKGRYQMRYICNYENLAKAMDADHIRTLECCDIFIYQPFNKQHTESEYDISKVKNYLKPDCLILRANYYRFKGFWYESDYIPYTNYKKYVFCKSPYCSLHKSFIGFKGGMEEIVRKIDSISIDNEAFMAYFNEQIDQFKILDGNSDVKMTEYLINNYKTKRLFHDVWHPTNLFLYEVFRQIVFKIDGHNLHYEDMEFIRNFDHIEMTHWASPILPIIENYLGLELPKRITLFRFPASAEECKVLSVNVYDYYYIRLSTKNFEAYLEKL